MSDVDVQQQDPARLPATIWLGNAGESLYLITTGAPVGAVDEYGYTPLTLAANDSEMDEVLRELLRRGADPNTAANDGATALGLAVRRDDVEMAKELVEHGARLNEKGQGGYTPLIWCLQSNASQCMAYLISKGADLDASGADGHTAPDWLEAYGYNDAADVLRAALKERQRLQELAAQRKAAAEAAAETIAQHGATRSTQDVLRDKAPHIKGLKP